MEANNHIVVALKIPPVTYQQVVAQIPLRLSKNLF
jgi:hypothetical protein